MRLRAVTLSEGSEVTKSGQSEGQKEVTAECSERRLTGLAGSREWAVGRAEGGNCRVFRAQADWTCREL
jgi:hypothetical protein